MKRESTRRGSARIAILAALAFVVGVFAPITGAGESSQAAYGSMIQPVSGSVTGYLNYRCSSGVGSHAGIDIAGNNGAAIVAAYPGEVTVRQVSFATTGYGNMVTIKHDGGYTTLYAHMNAAPLVQQGQEVAKGQTLGYVGNTGNSSGAHLHFEVKRNGTNLGGSLGYSCGEQITRGTGIPYSFPGLGSASFDYNSDGHDDIFGVHTDGRLLMYAGTGSGTIQGAAAVGSGWGTTTAITHGDYNGDGRNDLITNRSDGTVIFYPGNGAGAFNTPMQVGHGWVSDPLVTGGVDFTGDGRDDLVTRDAGGSVLRIYPGNGSGGFGNSTTTGPGWSATRLLTAGDYNGDGRGDLLAINDSGELRLYTGNGASGFTGSALVGGGWTGASSIVGGVDMNGDGRADLVSKTSSATLNLYAGNGNGTFNNPTQIGSGWSGIRLLG